jgi:hypothetical protein
LKKVAAATQPHGICVVGLAKEWPKASGVLQYDSAHADYAAVVLITLLYYRGAPLDCSGQQGKAEQKVTAQIRSESLHLSC